MKKLRTPEEWLKTGSFKGYIIIDPDGWDRRPDNWEKSWNEKITGKEMWRRLMMSTIGLK